MRNHSLFFSKRNLFLINLSFWVIMWALSMVKNAYYAARSGEDFDWVERTVWVGADYFSLWMLSFVIYYLFHKTIQREWKPFVAIHLPVSLVAGVCNLALSVLIVMGVMRMIKPHEMPFLEAFMVNMRNFMAFSINGFLIYWLVLLILFALNFYARYKNQHIVSLELESQLNQSKLQTLRMQLNPHFLFNSLNTISMMVRNNKGSQAVDMISGLSDLLRHTLGRQEEQFVRFEEEVSLVRQYLQIEQIRFQDRLKLSFDIDPKSRSVPFPSLLLQPILENAFKHGISDSLGEVEIRLASKKEEDRLHVCISNSGPFLPADWKLKDQKGIGLTNTLSRLQQLFGDDHYFSIKNQTQSGVTVHLEIPTNRQRLTDHGKRNTDFKG